ncbi:MAG: phosphoglycerate kinase, partial [Halobacteriota archaeon]|nr:phosphoglycerate kinase [Halobacteriota archaeon]
MEYLTMSDAELKDKVVLVRLDLNSPIKDGTILDDKRFRSHLETLEGLKDSKAVLMSHQGRAGGKDFTTMEAHKEKLSELIGREIKYVDDIFGSHARNEIGKMKNGDILLLENLRFYSEESLKRSPEEHAETHLVRNLASSADIFINDAFSTAHRSQLSIVGFTPVLPSYAGRLMEKEVNAHEKVL